MYTFHCFNHLHSIALGLGISGIAIARTEAQSLPFFREAFCISWSGVPTAVTLVTLFTLVTGRSNAYSIACTRGTSSRGGLEGLKPQILQVQSFRNLFKEMLQTCFSKNGSSLFYPFLLFLFYSLFEGLIVKK